MKLLTKELRKQFPLLYANENKPKEETKVIAKFFTPWTNWTWYATEFDGVDLFYGLIQGLEEEYGYFSLKELESIRGPFGLKIERDLYFKNKTLKDVEKK